MSQQPNMEEILCDYLDGTLDAKRRRAVETLLHHDAKLRKALAAMQQVRGVLRDLPVEVMPADAANALQRELRPAAQPSIPLYSPQWLIRLAAALAIAVTAGLLIWAMLPSPMARRTVAMDAAAPMSARAHAVTMKMDSTGNGLADKDTSEPTLAMKRALGGGGAGKMGAAEPLSTNESALMVVVADDISSTERDIRNLLTLNNIHFESVNPSAAERDELAKELQTQSGGTFATNAIPDAASPARVQERTGVAKAEAGAQAMASAAPAPSTPAAPSALAVPSAPAAGAGSAMAAGRAAGPGSGRGLQAGAAQSIASAKPAAQPLGGSAQRRSQGPARQANSEPYGVVIARNVTPDQLGKLRSGLRDASRAGNMRVVDPSVNRVTQAETDGKQALNRNEQTDLNQRPVQMQSPWQYSNNQALQNTQEPALQNTTQPPISYSPRYDVTIVVQGENAAADIPTWPAPATRPNSTAPSTTPAIP